MRVEQNCSSEAVCRTGWRGMRAGNRALGSSSRAESKWVALGGVLSAAGRFKSTSDYLPLLLPSGMVFANPKNQTSWPVRQSFWVAQPLRKRPSAARQIAERIAEPMVRVFIFCCSYSPVIESRTGWRVMRAGNRSGAADSRAENFATNQRTGKLHKGSEASEGLMPGRFFAVLASLV